MTWLEAVTLGFAQGLTEFLPVSSSAHLRLVPEVFGWADPGAAFTAIVQLGTVAAVVAALRDDLAPLPRAAAAGLRSAARRDSPDWRLCRQLVIATIPIVIVGAIAAPVIEGPARNLGVVLAALVAGSAWMWFAESRSRAIRGLTETDSHDALTIGVAQVAALIPGVSRSGATISAGLQVGLDRASAARYSFLLSVPAVVLAGLFAARRISGEIDLGPTVLATAIAFASGYGSIRWLLRVLARTSLRAFVVYRLAVVFAALLAIVVGAG